MRFFIGGAPVEFFAWVNLFSSDVLSTDRHSIFQSRKELYARGKGRSKENNLRAAWRSWGCCDEKYSNLHAPLQPFEMREIAIE